MKKTVLHQKQLQTNAKMADCRGWHIPLHYSTPQDEYYAVRTAVGLFDVSYLGRIELSGPGAGATLQRVFTANVTGIAEGSACYGLICNEAGFIQNDGYAFHLQKDRYLVTTDPLTIDTVLSVLQASAKDKVEIADQTRSLAQFALQGPLSQSVLERLLPRFKKFKPKAARELTLLGTSVVISRTGYTGEHGYELIMPAEHAEAVWDALLEAGRETGILPCGFTCRDILRQEMGFPLYGNEIDETRNPYEAGLESSVDLNKEFNARNSLKLAASQQNKQRLVGLEVFDQNVPKKGNIVFSENHEIGVVTSGCRSPHVRKGIGLAYVVERYASPGLEVEIETKDQELAARVVEIPFYRKK